MNRGWDARCTPTIERTKRGRREDDNALENGPGAKSNRPLPDQEIRQVSNAIVDIGSYADERERLTCHTEKLEEAEAAITLVRDNRYAKA